jgi:hypothetical protein
VRGNRALERIQVATGEPEHRIIKSDGQDTRPQHALL